MLPAPGRRQGTLLRSRSLFRYIQSERRILVEAQREACEISGPREERERGGWMGRRWPLDADTRTFAASELAADSEDVTSSYLNLNKQRSCEL